MANPAQSHPNATTAGVTGSLLILIFYVGGLFGWHPPSEVVAAISTLVTTAVVAIGPLVRYQRR